MIKAFVFGKFLPFHKGHEAMINFALTQCDFLSVLVCCSDKEIIEGSIREKWITQTIKMEHKVEIITFNYNETVLPNTSETSLEVSQMWAAVFKERFPDSSLLITSERYGNLVADFMKIRHITFDLDRETFPVSGSKIGLDIFSYWNYLPEYVKRDFAIKVVIVGTESTGKTTLANNLARHYDCELVEEAGRELIPDSNDFSFNDLHLVAELHAKRINQAISGNSPLIIIDTDIHTTFSYSRFVFKRDMAVNESVYKTNRADLYLYLNNDVAYFQDGTRLEESYRNFLDQSHRQVLKDHDIKITEICGDWETRFARAVTEIDQLCNKRKSLQLR